MAILKVRNPNGSWSDIPAIKGEPGASVTIKNVSESTADGGNNVVTFSDGKTVTIKNGSKGTKGDKGDTGATGPQGPAGEDGKDGASGTSVAVKSVSESSTDGGSNVVTFTDGKTITIKNGTKGSKGDKGDTGATGSTGPKGAEGPAGKDGVSGVYVGTSAPTSEVNVWINPAGDEVDIGSDVIRYIPQTLTDAQKAQARRNVGALSKDSLSLGIASDGFIYLFVDGNPVGSGIQMGNGGDVFG